MRFPRLRRALLTAACALPIVLAACGGGDIVSELKPSRLVVFGDAFSDVGQRGVRYTVNGAGPNWTEQFASRYGLPIAPSANGGTSYAIGSARVTAKPDAGGNAATPTVTEQITTFLGSGGVAGNDLIIVSGGTADILAESAALREGRQSGPQTRANVEQAGRELGAQVQRIVDAGATHVMVVGPYNLGRSPWAIAQQGGVATTCELRDGNREDATPSCLSSAFNQALLVSIVKLGGKVRFVDAALHLNRVTATPVSFDFDDAVNIACNSVDAGPGIGIGAGQVSSALCTTSTLTGVNVGRTVFADPIYLTPAANVSFGNYAFDQIRETF